MFSLNLLLQFTRRDAQNLTECVLEGIISCVFCLLDGLLPFCYCAKSGTCSSAEKTGVAPSKPSPKFHKSTAILRGGRWFDSSQVLRIVMEGAPLVRLVIDVAATLCTGSLVFAAFFVGPRPDGQLSAAGYAAVRMAGRWGLVWLVD